MTSNVCLIGTGRMARVLLKTCPSDIHILGALGRDPAVGCALLPHLPSAAQAAIDFSHPSLTLAVLPQIVAQKIPLLIGTTGFSATEKQYIQDAAQVVPILLAPNTSMGVYMMSQCAQWLHQQLPNWNVHLEETHHTQKKDAPSGTALMLAEKIGMHKDAIVSHRVDNAVGTHTLVFGSATEQITITHTALDRQLFGIGAFRLLEKLKKCPPKLYTVEELLAVC